MNQTRLESAIEIGCSMAFGYVVGVLSQLLVFPPLGIHATWSQNFWVSVWFTVIGVARSYAFRRFFNAGLHRVAVAIAVRLLSRKPN